MLGTFFYQPMVNRDTEFLFKNSAEGYYTIPTQISKFLCTIRFLVMGKYKVLEWNAFICHRMEKCLQFFCFVITAKEPDKFLMFQVPQR